MAKPQYIKKGLPDSDYCTLNLAQIKNPVKCQPFAQISG
jgi:hypothetical protein